MPDLCIGQTTVSLVSPLSIPPSSAPGVCSKPLTLPQVIDKASFPVSQPSYLPKDFEVFEAAHIDTPREAVVVTYVRQGGPASVILVETPLDQAGVADRVSQTYLVLGETLQASTVGDAPAALIQGSARPGTTGLTQIGVAWENGRILTYIIVQGLEESDLKAIAESLPRLS